VGDGSGSYCFSQHCSACVHNPYASGNDDPTEYDCLFGSATCTFEASNSYAVTMPDSGNVTVCVRVVNEHGCLDSACITIGVTPVSAPVLSGGGTLCASNAALSCFGETGYTYQLQNDLAQAVGVPLSGANALLNFPITATGTYTVVATDAVTSCVVRSNAQAVDFYTALSPGAITTASYISCNNVAGAVAAETTPPSGGDGDYTYQWTVRYNGGAAATVTDPAATAATYQPPATTTAGTYVYNRQVKDGCAADFVPSAGTITREVYAAFNAGSINGSGTGTGTCMVVSIDAGVGVVASGASGNYTYRWIRVAPAATYAVNSANHAFTAAELATAGTYTYYREVHDNTCNPDVWSRSAGSYELTVPSCPYIGSDLYQDDSHPCQLRSSGAQNWEAWIKDAQDTKIYRIILMPDCTWWLAQTLAREAGTYSTHASNGMLYYTDTTVGCPAGWTFPSPTEWEAMVTTYGGSYYTNIKTTTGWAGSSYSAVGTDYYGISIAPTGVYAEGGSGWTAGWYNTTMTLQMGPSRTYRSDTRETHTGMSYGFGCVRGIGKPAETCLNFNGAVETRPWGTTDLNHGVNKPGYTRAPLRCIRRF
ncbi:MAG: hypothetical protein LBF19_03030, partial [Prevotellaceae bacterium]|jgi:uncharacterized protein (TIGR02145 family)|nr:hypothetical protein [Prevotellaceae bacterium]